MLTEVNSSLYSKAKTSKLNIVLDVLIILIMIALVFEIIFCMNYTGIYVVGSSMNNTLIGAPNENSAGGDYVYVNRHAKPDYGDIVVVNTDELDEFGGAKTIIKRVIALGGDTLKLDKGTLYIKYGKSSVKYSGIDDFVQVTEDYVAPEHNVGTGNEPYTFPEKYGKLDEEGYFVAEGYVFVMGDNRDVSFDSRRRGAFEIKRVFGVVTDWSVPVDGKSVYTSLHQFFYFDVPKFFGVK